MIGFFDTNILVDYLRGDARAKKEFGRYERLAISLITWMEILVGAENVQEESQLKGFMGRFQVIEISREIAERAVHLRRKLKIRIPDAIILATAHELNSSLVTRNTRDFPRGDLSIRVPY